MVAGDIEVSASMSDLMDLFRVGKDAVGPVPHHGVFFPAAFEKLVENLYIFRRHFVPVGGFSQAAFTNVLRAALEIRGDDVPAYSSFRMMIGGRKPPRKRIRMLERSRRRNADAQMFGHHRDGRGE